MQRQSLIKSYSSHALSASGPPPGQIRSALAEAIAQLERASTPSAPLAAELLLMHVLERDRAWLYAHPEHEIDQATRDQYFALVARRASGVPTQHLTGHQEFWGLDFEVTPDVLIPRPETEHVIEVALQRLGVIEGADSSRRQAPFRIAEVGTGSGCIAIALAEELPQARVIATDVSGAALEVARRNATRHDVLSRIEFVNCSLLDCLNPGPPRFDLVVSNPPYIGLGEAATLPREVREHEPATALFAGEKGTELYAPLIAQAALFLKAGGFLVVELGYNSAEHVLRLPGSPEWTDVAMANDLAGITRVASARRREKA